MSFSLWLLLPVGDFLKSECRWDAALCDGRGWNVLSETSRCPLHHDPSRGAPSPVRILQLTAPLQQLALKSDPSPWTILCLRFLLYKKWVYKPIFLVQKSLECSEFYTGSMSSQGLICS